MPKKPTKPITHEDYLMLAEYVRKEKAGQYHPKFGSLDRNLVAGIIKQLLRDDKTTTRRLLGKADRFFNPPPKKAPSHLSRSGAISRRARIKAAHQAKRNQKFSEVYSSAPQTVLVPRGDIHPVLTATQ